MDMMGSLPLKIKGLSPLTVFHVYIYIHPIPVIAAAATATIVAVIVIIFIIATIVFLVITILILLSTYYFVPDVLGMNIQLPPILGFTRGTGF